MNQMDSWRTQRLQLDALTPDDAVDLFAYRSDARVARYQGWVPANVEEARAFIAAQRSAPLREPGAWKQLAIRTLHEGRLVGDIGLHFPEDDHGSFEFGVSLRPGAQGQGFAHEAVVHVLAWVFGPWGIRRTVASVDPRNTASMALLQRLGFRQEAHHRESYLLRGEWVDDCVFAMLAAEWMARGDPAGR